jgi:SSS family transporter
MNGLSAPDWAVVAVYFLAVAAVGILVSRGQRSTRDYFLGGRSLPWWAAALSIIATETSAVTIIGFPAAAFEHDWRLLQLFAGFVLGRVFLAAVFVRVFYRAEHVTVYGFLADRFGESARAVSAVLFLCGRVVASGVRLFAGALAVEAATGLGTGKVIVALAAIGTVFTLLGGIRAVVWTDVILGLTFLLGGALSAVFLLDAIPGGLEAVFASPELAVKTRVFHLDRGIADSGGLVCGLIGGFVLTLATHGTDQDVAQRMIACRDSRSGGLSVLGSAALIVPLATLFLAVGTLLWFHTRLGSPGYEIPADLKELYPVFIVRALPVGLAGLVMAGLLAASLSSFTSVLNALAATTIGDFYRPLLSGGRTGRTGPPRAEAHFVRASRIATLLWAAALVAVAAAFIGSQANLIELALKALNYFHGALLGAFLLGMLTGRGTSRSVVAGMLASVPVVLLLQLRQFVDAPGTAPGTLQGWIEGLSSGTREAIQTAVPDVAWPYWIVISTAVTLAVGALGRASKGR